jgi:uncharacterized membrane protein YdcZ (DUF606 family)
MFLKVFLFFSFLVGLVLLGYCWWGLHSAAGREMFAGVELMLPLYVGGLGGAIVILSSFIYLSRRFGTRRDDR